MKGFDAKITIRYIEIGSFSKTAIETLSFPIGQKRDVATGANHKEDDYRKW